VDGHGVIGELACVAKVVNAGHPIEVLAIFLVGAWDISRLHAANLRVYDVGTTLACDQSFFTQFMALVAHA
jgi:hypothetical protein